MRKKYFFSIFLSILCTFHINTIINKLIPDCISFGIGSTLPFYVSIFGTDRMANLTKKTLASQKVVDIIQETLGKDKHVFEKIYVGDKDMVFSGYVPNNKTVVFSPAFVDSLVKYKDSGRDTIRHEYSHAIRYSTEKIRFLCLIVPFITYKIMELVINKCKEKYGNSKMFSEYIAKIPSWVKSIIIGLALYLINQHIITAYTRYEEYMTDRTADKIFGGTHVCRYGVAFYDNKKDLIVGLAKKFFLPVFFWNHSEIIEDSKNRRLLQECIDFLSEQNAENQSQSTIDTL